MAGRKGREGQMLESVYSVLALVFILVACVELYDAATVLDVYRLIQYDLAGVPFGSRFANLNHHAGSFPFRSGADLSRTVVVIPVRELNMTILQEYITQKQRLGGLLLLLPQKFSFEHRGENGGQTYGKHVMQKVAELEKLLIHANLPYPVYFGFEDDKIDEVLADIKKNDATDQHSTATIGGYKFVVSTPEPKKVSSAIIANIQGWLPGLKADGDVNQLPTIAIVASYDTFGAAPALSVGSDSNGGGVVALLEIARLFSRLYSNPKTRGRYNLLFGLTSGGPYNYNGTLKWLRSLDHRVRESIDYAVCLNSIAPSENELWMHVSKPPENVHIKHLFEGFSNVAKDLGVNINLKHKKINISDARVAWEHEQFSRLRVTAITLSELSVPPELLDSTGGLYDKGHFGDRTAVFRSAKLVAESLARHIYAPLGKNVQIFADGSSLAVNPSYINSWLDLFSRTPRMAPFLSKNDPFITALKRELAEHIAEVHVQYELLDGMFSFYDSTRARLNVYQVASVTFDLLLLLALGSYLILLFSSLVIVTRGVDDLIGIFRRPPSRKFKTA
ncbi:Nicalin [Thalictrum thalictroides]|uniref:Nicalin n=1 Tax=Thalictrum thalictroides TaxID=46969 RepID=A0A7J6V8R2_THATH|nr:Nicalin [Thalictrum thalictroides]